MTSPDAITVGIVNHNGAGYLPRTLEAVGRLGPAVGEVLLIDNASTDGGVALVERQFPRVRVIEMGDNRGPGPARNAALRQARHDRVLLIDNDVQPQPGCIEALSGALDAHPGAVLAMPAIVYEDRPDTVQYAGAEPHFLGTAALLFPDSPLDILDTRVRVVGTSITCCLFVDRARSGGASWFDERMFIYLEDHEFGLRAALSGFEILVVPAARCLHGAGTLGMSIRQTGRFTPARVRHTIRNRWLVLLKLYQWRTLLRFAPALAAFEVLQLLGALHKGWLGHWLWAVGSIARLSPHILRERLAFGRRRRRADLDVLVGGPFPYNKALSCSRLERAARQTLDAIARLNWRIAGGKR